MDSDDSNTGYDPQMDRTAEPHNEAIGVGVPEQSYRQLVRELANARSMQDLVGTMKRYGWLPPIVGLLLYGFTRGIFEHLTEPFAMSQGYIFTGWQLALGINLLFGVFIVGFTWFLYFGVAGSIAGFFSDKTNMDSTVFKAGGYLSVLFVPVLVISWFLALTIPAPEAVVAGVEPTADVIETHRVVANSPQMRIVDLLLSATWIVVGFLLLPIISELYDINRKQSVISVLPVTLLAVIGTQLV
ncbi:hypothetical protein [Haloarcula marina]|uniref:hypothetical protein n=1 Tax=Haloarcula marina TaxID=2961574 RepID=UPI0020B770EF|nr:hypothetical protein [Halomicroarcula marina]